MSYIVITKKDRSSEEIYFLESVDVLSIANQIAYAKANNLELILESNICKEPIVLNGKDILEFKIVSR